MIGPVVGVNGGGVMIDDVETNGGGIGRLESDAVGARAEVIEMLEVVTEVAAFVG